MDHRIVFTHPAVEAYLKQGGKYSGSRTMINTNGALEITTGANEVTWGYGLNSATFPTYGGEVVQILSVYIDDLQIGGDLPTYRAMEEVYLWFLTYMAISTQGAKDADDATVDVGRFNQEPVHMHVISRDWTFNIKPTALPGFTYSRDMTVPTWQLTAAVEETDTEVQEATLKGAEAGLERISVGIGYEKFNPFSAPNKSIKGFKSVQKELDRIGDQYIKMVKEYSDKDFSSFDPPASGPPRPVKKDTRG